MNMKTISIVMLGESGVGKSSLLHRFLHGVFKQYLSNTFVDHYTKKVQVKGIEINVRLWDTAGQEAYNQLIKSYFRIADGVLLVYDVDNISTCQTLSNWWSELRALNGTAEIVIAGNKHDDRTKISKTCEMAQNFARRENLELMEVSAKTGGNVDSVFEFLLEKILVAKGVLPRSDTRQVIEGLFYPSSLADSDDRTRSYGNNPPDKNKKNASKSEELVKERNIILMDEPETTKSKCGC